MNTFLIPLHSMLRWLLLAAVLFAVGKAFSGYLSRRDFSDWDSRLASWTATVAHMQLVVGMALYVRSPLTSYFWKNIKPSFEYIEIVFYGLLHPLLMLLAVTAITVGPSLAKRRPEDRKKHWTLFLCFSIALAVMLLAVPWPFSPLSQRPYFRGF